MSARRRLTEREDLYFRAHLHLGLSIPTISKETIIISGCLITVHTANKQEFTTSDVTSTSNAHNKQYIIEASDRSRKCKKVCPLSFASCARSREKSHHHCVLRVARADGASGGSSSSSPGTKINSSNLISRTQQAPAVCVVCVIECEKWSAGGSSASWRQPA